MSLPDQDVIIEAGFDEDTQTLELKFSNGSVYQFYNIDPHAYHNLVDSKFRMAVFLTTIKDVYPYSRVG